MTRNKLFKILLSAVLAFSLWLYVIMVVSPGSEQTYYDIPVVFQNENVLAERGLIVTEYDSSVTLTLGGNRTDLNTMNENNINILANVSGIMAPGVHKINYDINYPGNIADNAITTNSKSVDMLTVKVENLITKDVLVEYNGSGKLPENYHPQAPVYSVEGLAVESIQVTGPESVVNKIAYAVVPVVLEGRTESISADMEYILCDEGRQRVDVNPDLVTTNAQTIRMDMKIHRYVELPLAVELVSGGGATEKNCKVTISPIDKLTVSGEDKVLKDMKSLIIGSVDLAELTEDTTLNLPLALPEGVTNRTEGCPETVEVKLSLQGLQTKTLQVNQFRITNKPQDMKYDGVPSSLQVQVRGPEAQVSKLNASDITVVIDLQGTQAGANPVQARLELGDDFKDVGVLSKHEIVVTMKAQ